MPNSIKCDLHIHSQFSDGKLSVAEIVDLYGRQGFGAIAITDHLCERNNLIGRVSHGLSYSLSEQTFPEYMSTLRAEALRAWMQYKLVLIPGYEITKNSFHNHRSAHLLIIGTDKYISPELPVEDVLMAAKELNALTVAAHPFPTGEIEFQTFYLWSQREKLKDMIDAWEINCRKNIYSTMLTSGLPLIANSDFHHNAHYSSWKSKIYAERNQADIFKAIRSQSIDFFLDQNMAV
jgi:PHP domain